MEEKSSSTRADRVVGSVFGRQPGYPNPDRKRDDQRRSRLERKTGFLHRFNSLADFRDLFQDVDGKVEARSELQMTTVGKPSRGVVGEKAPYRTRTGYRP